MCPSVIRLIPELRSNQVVFLNVLGIFVVFISYCWTYPYPFSACFLKTQLFAFYLYTCIIWLEVRNRAEKTLPKERPVHRLLYVIGY